MLYISRMYMPRVTKEDKYTSESKAEALQHFKVDTVLKIYATVYSSLNLLARIMENFVENKFTFTEDIFSFSWLVYS